ncbi:MAG: hypothetical protein WC010_02950 [Candidatus Absconditabacterales bacterium]
MKKTNLIGLIGVILILLSMQSCKAPSVGIAEMHEVNYDGIMKFRTILGPGAWGKDTLDADSLAEHATQNFRNAYYKYMMKDSTKMNRTGFIPDIIEEYVVYLVNIKDGMTNLEEPKIGIPGKIYRISPRFSEELFSMFISYVTKIGNRTALRDLEIEKTFRDLFDAPDSTYRDSLNYSSTAAKRFYEYYSNVYSAGEEVEYLQKLKPTIPIAKIQSLYAKLRYKDAEQKGYLESYETRYYEEQDVYYILMPLE